MQPRAPRAIAEEHEDDAHSNRPKESLMDLMAGDKQFSATPQQRTAPAVILQTAPSHFSPSAAGKPTDEYLRDQGKSRFALPNGVAAQSMNRPNRPPQLGRYAGHSEGPESRPKPPAQEMAEFFNSPPPPPVRVPEPELKGGFKGFMQKFGKRPVVASVASQEGGSVDANGAVRNDNDETRRVGGGSLVADSGPQTSRGIAEEYRARLAAASAAKQYSKSLNEPDIRIPPVPPVPAKLPPLSRTNVPRVAPRTSAKAKATDTSAQTDMPREPTIPLSALSWLYGAIQSIESAPECRLVLNSALMQLGVPRGDAITITPEERVAGWLLGGMMGPEAPNGDAQAAPIVHTSSQSGTRVGNRDMQPGAQRHAQQPSAQTVPNAAKPETQPTISGTVPDPSATAPRGDHQIAGPSTLLAGTAATAGQAISGKARAEARRSRIIAKQARGVEDEQGYS
jgi:hypothetical protein